LCYRIVQFYVYVKNSEEENRKFLHVWYYTKMYCAIARQLLTPSRRYLTDFWRLFLQIFFTIIWKIFLFHFIFLQIEFFFSFFFFVVWYHFHFYYVELDLDDAIIKLSCNIYVWIAFLCWIWKLWKIMCKIFYRNIRTSLASLWHFVIVFIFCYLDFGL
jgi:hypothetical protein